MPTNQEFKIIVDNLIAFFNNTIPLSDKVLGLIGQVFTQDELKKGDYFIKKGQYAKEIAFLEEGIVRAFYVNNAGKEYNKTFVSVFI